MNISALERHTVQNGFSWLVDQLVKKIGDSIQNGKTGLLVPTNPQALAKTSLKLLKNEALRVKLSRTGYNWSKKFTWQNCYQDFKIISHISKSLFR